jgi:hypothetical protein
MKVYSILKPIFKIIPKRLGHSLNKVISNVVISAMKTKGEDIWVRNSIACNYDKFGSSDIDLTLITNDFKNSNALRRYHKLKKVIPLLKEINVYSNLKFSKFYNKFNQCEIQRDPILLDKYNLKRESTSFEEIVFILKMCESNQYGLIRDEKWKYYKSLTKLKSNSSQSLDIFENYKEELSDLEAVFSKNHNLEQSLESFSEKSNIVFNTNKWIVEIITKSMSVQQTLDLYFFSLEEKNIIEAFLWWEAQGLLTQQDMENEKTILNQYISYFIEVSVYFEFRDLEEFFTLLQENLVHNL